MSVSGAAHAGTGAKDRLVFRFAIGDQMNRRDAESAENGNSVSIVTLLSRFGCTRRSLQPAPPPSPARAGMVPFFAPSASLRLNCL